MSDNYLKDLFISEAKVSLTAPTRYGGGSEPANIQPLEVTENGVYEIEGDVDGYGPVTVNVESSGEWKPIGDGNTHLWITLHEGRTSPMLGVCPNGTVTVDWGDGTEPDVLTGTSVQEIKYTPNHEYGKAGDYIITLTVDGEMGFYESNSGSRLLGANSTSSDSDYVYRNAIQKIEIGSCVTSIGTYAFSSCNSLTNIVIPDSVTSIGDNAFNSCNSLTNIVIPDSVTSIGTYAFSSCASLANIVIPDSVTSIGTYAFYVCHSLYSIVIPDSVTSIGSQAFYGCRNLANIVISEGVTSIGSQTFYNCCSLSSVVIPEGVTIIGRSSFGGCHSVAYYDFTKHTAIPTLGYTNAFTGIAADCEIRVPAALAEEWKAATNWSTYANNIVGV